MTVVACPLRPGVLQLAVGQVNLGSLAEDLAERVRVLGSTRGVEVQARIVGDAPVVDGDPERLEQVGLILLDNAIKHTSPGNRVQILARRAEADGLLEIIDTGERIPPEHFRHIFDRFYRVDRARSRATGGVGLGLSIAQSLIAAHGGHISISSQLGTGTRVTIRLPLVAEGPALAAILSPHTRQLDSPHRSARRRRMGSDKTSSSDCSGVSRYAPARKSLATDAVLPTIVQFVAEALKFLT